ncbi:hypothetical protein AAG570_004495 [Ranatra chinensis]|uniref:Peptidase S1 domain-containing protein n=1 Tax=Ranatra chinensis TaxID=642074 RepID=A0ABD0YDN6_9HEMI
MPRVCCPRATPTRPTTPPTQTPPTRPGSNSQQTSNDNMYRNLPSAPACGKSEVDEHDKIVGGTPSLKGAWPWLAALGYRSQNDPTPRWRCAGALISQKYVLTAAHCARHPSLTLFLVRLGEHNLDDRVADGANPVDIPIERVISHPRYDALSKFHDIALIRLSRPVTFSRDIQPICLPKTTEIRTANLEGDSPFVAGWGSVGYKEPSSNALLEVQVPITDNESCKRKYAQKKGVIIDQQLCAGYEDGGKDACQGDSGGPLMMPRNLYYYIIGVVSYGYQCAQPGYPGIYTRVTEYLDWISKNMT